MLTKPHIGRAAIVGCGLAGCCLAWRIWQTGGEVHFFDQIDPLKLLAETDGLSEKPSHAFPTPSMVAGGLVTPVQGQRFATPAEYQREFKIADEFYSSIENQTGVSFWDKRQSVRFLQSSERAQRFAKRQSNSAGTDRDINRQINTTNLKIDAGDFRNEFSGFDMPNAARLRVGAFIHATLNSMKPKFEFTNRSIDPWSVSAFEHGLRLPNIETLFDRIIFCTGTSIHATEWTSDLQPRYAGGELLLLKLSQVNSATTDLLDRYSAIHREGWTYPVDQRDADLPLFDLESGAAVSLKHYLGQSQPGEQLVMFGATYLDSVHLLGPRRVAPSELTERFKRAYSGPFEPLAITFGTRPIIAGRQPIVRWDGHDSRIGFLGGLASHGVRTAPYLAQRLIESLG